MGLQRLKRQAGVPPYPLLVAGFKRAGLGYERQCIAAGTRLAEQGQQNKTGILRRIEKMLSRLKLSINTFVAPIFWVIGLGGHVPVFAFEQNRVFEKNHVENASVQQALQKQPTLSSSRILSADYAAVCQQGIVSIKEKLAALEDTPSATRTQVLEQLNELLIDIDLIWNHAILFSYNHPDEAVRKVAGECNAAMNQVDTDISLSSAIYTKLMQLDADSAAKQSLSQGWQRFLQKRIESYQLSGINLAPEKQATLKQLQQDISRLGSAYLKNIREGVQQIELDSPQDLAGLPDDFIAAHPKNAAGKIVITTQYTDYQPFMLYAENDAHRQNLMRAFLNRGYPENHAIIKELVAKRHQMAQLLGFNTFAEYITKDKMVGSAKKAQAFIDSVHQVAKPKADKELAMLLTQLQKMQPQASAVNRWQYRYLAEQIKQEQYQIDAKEVRQYFAYTKVKTGIFSLVEHLFGIQIKSINQQKNTPVWHSDVESFQVWQNNKLIAHFHLDSHPRENKYNHAASFPITTGVKGRYLPEAALVMNFPKTYLEHDQVVLFLHEFGHLIHHLFSSEHEVVALAGLNTEVDFFEAPSQMLEEWVWDYDTLKQFATNDAGEVIPKALVDRMNRARHLLSGILTQRQLVYSGMSLGIHNQAPSNIQWDALQAQYFAKYSPFPNVDGGNMQASFEHLVGYSAVYYTYTWSRVIAADMLTRFAKEGMTNPKTANEYRQKVLAPGGKKTAGKLVEDFLGRPYSYASFKAQLGL
ncbi:M3 family metallopeptidase [Alteromonas sp. a30]|uniref:M3 family metallopeptidase n=1 Tax=Alteromonas sp. a30 TaxID=2730917 RepID=UPI00227E742C|nr:M3 family metallopeptidase [Alteromonas sp. a30]MCY7296885.1 Zn-dependent oligopeptidase [Alteromonas sp. a30]